MNIKQHFSNSETLINSYGKDSIFNDRNTLTINDNGYWVINGKQTSYNISDENVGIESVIPSRDPSDTLIDKTRSDDYKDIFDKNIQLINRRLANIQKELTYWDLYKLAVQVKDPSELNSKFTSLLPGHALVINCYTFIDNGETYHLGDIIVKDLDGDAIKIDTLATGIYEPEITTDGSGNIKLVYTYTNQIPTGNAVTKEVNLDRGSAAGSYIYGLYKDISSMSSTTFDIFKENNQPIYPVIKFFVVYNDNTQEEVDVHHTITVQNNKWLVSWEPNTIASIMQVK